MNCSSYCLDRSISLSLYSLSPPSILSLLEYYFPSLWLHQGLPVTRLNKGAANRLKIYKNKSFKLSFWKPIMCLPMRSSTYLLLVKWLLIEPCLPEGHHDGVHLLPPPGVPGEDVGEWETGQPGTLHELVAVVGEGGQGAGQLGGFGRKKDTFF